MSHAQMPLTFSEDEVTQGPLQGSLTSKSLHQLARLCT